METSRGIKKSSKAANVAWTREKISKLISLYQSNECLWNNYIECYKNKEMRNNKINEICSILGITKNDCARKIHNLRNQFNAEMKKIEKNMESSHSTSSRWEHFESLKFLKDVISPRPGYTTMFKGTRRVQITYSVDNSDGGNGDDDEDDALSSTEPTNTNTITFVSMESPEWKAAPSSARNDAANRSTANNSPHRRKDERIKTEKSNVENVKELCPLYITERENERGNERDVVHVCEMQIHPQRIPSPSSTAVEIQSPIVLTSPATQTPLSNDHKNITYTKFVERNRDEWDAFGEIVAAEFRQFSSEVLRRKLKRKMMQAMLEVGGEDDKN